MEISGSPVPTLRDYLDVLRRRKWIFLQAVLIVPVVAVALALREPPVYQASAEVLLNRQSLATQLFNINDPAAWDPSRIAKTQASIARVPEVARRALAAAGITDRDASDLLGRSSVSPKEETDLLVFSVSDSNPELATRLATEYARQYTEYRNEIESESLRGALEEVRAEMAALEDSGQAGSATYKSLADKEEQLHAMEALQTSRAVLVRPAGGAGQIAPQPVRRGVLGAMAGVVLGLILVFLFEALDTRIHGTPKIRDLLDLPLLARLGKPARGTRNKDVLVTLSDPHSRQAGAFRILSSNLDLINADLGARTIMVTSAVAGEGKSTTIANLGVALARQGRQVILVDLDLRQPSLHRFFEIDQRPGFSDIVLAGAPLDEFIARITVSEHRATSFPTGTRQSVTRELSVLPAGSVPDDPGDFLGTRQVEAVLQNLSGRFDVVLIDSSPLLLEGAAVTLGGYVDALLVVTRLNSTRAPVLTDLRGVLDACPAKKLGLVVTDADIENAYWDDAYARYGSARTNGSFSSRRERPEASHHG